MKTLAKWLNDTNELAELEGSQTGIQSCRLWWNNHAPTSHSKYLAAGHNVVQYVSSAGRKL